MDNLHNQEKIDKYLDELASEYRTLLFNALVEQSDSTEDLNIADLLRIDNEIKKHLRSDYKRSERKRRFLLFGGLFYMFFALFMYLSLKIIKPNYNIDNAASLLSLTIGFLGLVFCMFSFVFPTATFSRKNKSSKASSEKMSIAQYNLIATWRDVEAFVSNIANDGTVSTPRSAITYLFDSRLIDHQEYTALRTLLKLRNEIVHASDCSYTYDEVQKTIDDAKLVLDKLKKLFK